MPSLHHVFVRDVLSLFGPHIVILLLTHIGLQVLLFKTSLFLEGIMVAILPWFWL